MEVDDTDFGNDAYDGDYTDTGVDLELIHEALARTPLERLRHHRSWQLSVAWLHRAKPIAD